MSQDFKNVLPQNISIISEITKNDMSRTMEDHSFDDSIFQQRPTIPLLKSQWKESTHCFVCDRGFKKYSKHHC